MFKFLHTADFHFGANFSSFGDELSKKAEELQFQAVTDMVNYANLHKIDVFLIAGDTFDSHIVDFSHRNKLISILSNFLGEIYIVCGNHDYYYKGSFWDQIDFPENIHLIRSNSWQKFKFEKFTLHCASFTNIYEKIDISDLDIDENSVNIALVHADILTNSQYNSLSKEQIKTSKLDYLAVGHNHRCSDILKVCETHFCASGNISATGFDEKGEKGFVVITFHDDNSKDFEFAKSNGLEIFDYEVDITSFSSILEVRLELSKIASKNVFLNLKLSGVDNFGFDLNVLKTCIDDDFFAVLYTSFIDKPDDLWKYIDDDNILGEFSRLMRVKYDNSENRHEILNALKLAIDSLTF